MFRNWLRSNKYAATLLTILRLYLGWEFLSAGWEKISSPKAFTAAGYLANSVNHPVLGPNKHAVYPWFNEFLQNVAIPHVGLFNLLVPWGELLVGIGLILGILTTAAAFFGMLMNFMYLLSGTVSTNPIDILMGIFILSAGFNAGVIGGDRFLIPHVRKFFKLAAQSELTIGGGKAIKH